MAAILFPKLPNSSAHELLPMLVCPVCTLDNMPGSTHCEACQNAIPAHVKSTPRPLMFQPAPPLPRPPSALSAASAPPPFVLPRAPVVVAPAAAPVFPPAACVAPPLPSSVKKPEPPSAASVAPLPSSVVKKPEPPTVAAPPAVLGSIKSPAVVPALVKSPEPRVAPSSSPTISLSLTSPSPAAVPVVKPVPRVEEPRFSRPADDDEPEEEDGASLPSLEGIKHNLNLSSSSASSSSSSSSSSQSGKWFLYTLKCRNQKFFVGRAASRVFKPLIHFAREPFLVAYPPESVIDEKLNQEPEEEDRMIKALMHDKGIANVRGGLYKTVELDRSIQHLLEEEMLRLDGRCMRCHRLGHEEESCENVDYETGGPICPPPSPVNHNNKAAASAESDDDEQLEEQVRVEDNDEEEEEEEATKPIPGEAPTFSSSSVAPSSSSSSSSPLLEHIEANAVIPHSSAPTYSNSTRKRRLSRDDESEEDDEEEESDDEGERDDVRVDRPPPAKLPRLEDSSSSAHVGLPALPIPPSSSPAGAAPSVRSEREAPQPPQDKRSLISKFFRFFS